MTRDPFAALPVDLISVDAVAARMGVSRMTVYRLIHAEDLRAYRIGRSIRVDPRDVVAFVRAGNLNSWELNGGGES